MKTSELIGDLAAALAEAQAEFVNPDKNRAVTVQMKNGGSYSFEYATFDNILAMARPIMGRHGLAVIQGIGTHETEPDAQGAIYTIVTVTTRIAHKSGQWIEDAIAAVAENAEPQKIGSCTTYLKRYAYTSLVGIAAEEDDDGAAAGGHESAPRQRAEPKAKAAPKANGHADKAADTRTPAEKLAALKSKIPGIRSAADGLPFRDAAKKTFTGNDLEEALQEIDWRLIEVNENPFNAVASRIAMTYNRTGALCFAELRRRIGHADWLSADAKADLDAMLKTQEAKGAEAEKQAHANV